LLLDLLLWRHVALVLCWLWPLIDQSHIAKKIYILLIVNNWLDILDSTSYSLIKAHKVSLVCCLGLIEVKVEIIQV